MYTYIEQVTDSSGSILSQYYLEETTIPFYADVWTYGNYNNETEWYAHIWDYDTYSVFWGNETSWDMNDVSESWALTQFNSTYNFTSMDQLVDDVQADPSSSVFYTDVVINSDSSSDGSQYTFYQREFVRDYY